MRPSLTGGDYDRRGGPASAQLKAAIAETGPSPTPPSEEIETEIVKSVEGADPVAGELAVRRRRPSPAEYVGDATPLPATDMRRC
ncbi:MAG: hypothetical protein ACLU38_15850 [Dysosmobacter sp.]